jgi:hypothetical protein
VKSASNAAAGSSSSQPCTLARKRADDCIAVGTAIAAAAERSLAPVIAG